jgi:hydroxymethylglutaryl-CoA reductase
MSKIDSRIPGFYRLPLAARRAELMARTGLTEAELTAFDRGGLVGVNDPPAAAERIRAHEKEILALACAAVPRLVKRGGGPRDLEVRVWEGEATSEGQRAVERRLVVHMHVDCRDAMGANLVNTVAEAIAPRVAELGGGRFGLRILTNLCDRRLVRARVRVPFEALSAPGLAGDGIAEDIAAASRFAERDPYRAATHNKGIMNGVDAVVIASGNDWRGVEAGAHAYAARSGCYRPLATWSSEPGALCGTLEMPLAVGTVGGTLQVHAGARLAQKILGVGSASDLAMVAASVGLASNLAALRALATEGIQRGHMALHNRAVKAAAASAVADRARSNGNGDERHIGPPLAERVRAIGDGEVPG